MSFAAHVTASLFDQVVAETSARFGQNLVLGGTDALGIPRPAGSPHMARLKWLGSDKLKVIDARGEAHIVSADRPIVLTEGPITVEVRLVRRFRLRRMPALAHLATGAMSTMLLTILIGSFALVPATVDAARDTWCETWLGEVAPPNNIPGVRSIIACPGGGGAVGSGGGSELSDNLYEDDLWAEYLERILKKEFDGDADGVVALRGDRQYGEQERHDVYMPAGDSNDSGPMGGAKEVGARPIRTESLQKPKQEKKKKPQPLAANPDVGTPVDMPLLDPDEFDDETEDVAEVESDDEVDAIEERTEDREGWGVKDWYDQEAKERDTLENDIMQGYAKRILKIDPNDPEALAVLAYYQYLDEDLDGAEETYDKYIENNPDDAAGYNNKALVFKRRGDYETEEHLYRVALSLHPNDYTAMNNLAVNLGHQKRFDEALAIFDTLAQMQPDEPYTDLHRCKVYAEMGKDDMALQYLEKALAGMKVLGTQHAIEFRQDIRVDPSLERLRKTDAFRQLLWKYYGEDTPLPG